MGALCLINKLYLMNYFKTIKYYTEREMIDLSIDQIKLRIKKICDEHNNHETIVKKIKHGRTYAWGINYKFLHLFKRERALAKNSKNRKLKSQIKHSNIRKTRNYEYEISINLKDGLKQNDSQSYDQTYYSYIVEELFKITREDLLYVHEVDKYGYNHIHIACNGNEDDIKIALDFVMVNKLKFDRAFLKSSRAVHCEPLENEYAYRQYLKKIQQFPSFGAVATNSEMYIYEEDNYV